MREERGGRLSAVDPDVAATPTPTTPILTVRVGDAEFGLPAERVRQVLRPPELSRVPVADRRIRGLVSVRGTVLPVLDLGARLLDRPVTGPGRLAIVETSRGELVALLVDGLVDLTELPETEDRSASADIARSLPDGLAVRTGVSTRGRLVTLLDLDRVLDLHERNEEG